MEGYKLPSVYERQVYYSTAAKVLGALAIFGAGVGLGILINRRSMHKSNEPLEEMVRH